MKNNNTITQGSATWQCPSNIAIVKYWGKTGVQIPMNPSLSFSLKNSCTQTSIHYKAKENHEEFSFDFLLEGEPATAFENKLELFLNRIIGDLPWLKQYHLSINSSNTFPHSAGIASSASAYAALAKCLAQIHTSITSEKISENKISELARLGSGSACRSTLGGWNMWGKSADFKRSSDLHAINIDQEVHENFRDIRDTILIVSKSKKEISSTNGHALMIDHPYQAGRIKQAHKNMAKLKMALHNGNIKAFFDVAEEEALSLHGLMMSSNPGYTLLRPNSIILMDKIKAFRKETGLELGFTFDAGPNMHLLYTGNIAPEVNNFVKNELSIYCDNNFFIEDGIGAGPKQIN